MKNKIILVFLLVVDFSCLAQSNVSLVFHMGLGANGNYEIGGTIENNSTETLPHSAVTYITIDRKCNPSHAKVANLSEIKSKDALEFRIPIDGELYAYRILNITGWSDMGVKIDVDDKTEKVIRDRDSDFIKKCNSNGSD